MFKAWYPTVGHTLVKFDQCRLGQLVPKATCLSSDLAIQCWDGLSCNHPPHKLPEDMQSSDLSRYPPPMMQGLAGAISQALSDIGQEASKPTADWTHKHPGANDELPFRQQVRHMDHGLDRPTSLPLTHRISLMDEHVVVQLGFRTRPLRDGGGKPSPGRSQRVTTPHCSCGTTQISRAWGAPPTDSVLEPELDTPQSQVKGGWLLLVCHFLDALQTLIDNQ